MSRRLLVSSDGVESVCRSARIAAAIDARHRARAVRWIHGFLQDCRSRVRTIDGHGSATSPISCTFDRFFGETKPTLASSDYSTLVIFIVGGVTSHEIQLVHEYGQQVKKQVSELWLLVWGIVWQALFSS